MLFVDNYDSFVFNLVQYVGELGADTEVVRNDRAAVDELLAGGFTHVVVSPGPGTPADAGISAARHLEILAEHAPGLCFDTIVVDASFGADDATLQAYARCLGARLLIADVRRHDGTARHDPLRLASLFGDLMIS